MQKLRRRERTLVASLCYKLVTAYNERVVACTALELEMLQYLFLWFYSVSIQFSQQPMTSRDLERSNS